MKRKCMKFAYLLAIIVLIIIVPICFFLKSYNDSLTPEAVFSSTAVEFAGTVTELQDGMHLVSADVTNFVISHGVAIAPDEPVVAIRGYRIIKLEPEQFHGVHCRKVLEKGNADTVYFYSIHPRYMPTFAL